MKGLTRILALLLVFMMLASTFVSCGRQGSDDDDDSVISQRNRDDDRDEDENEDEDSPTPEATPEETPEATPAVTDEPTPEATPEPTAAAGSTVSVDEALGVIEDSTYTIAYFDLYD
jgi:cytoskeletal protein RodZ